MHPKLQELQQLIAEANELNLNKKQVIRDGKRVLVDKDDTTCPDGYKKDGDKCVRMTSKERRDRSLAAKKGNDSAAKRKRDNSLRRRDALITESAATTDSAYRQYSNSTKHKRVVPSRQGVITAPLTDEEFTAGKLAINKALLGDDKAAKEELDRELAGTFKDTDKAAEQEQDIPDTKSLKDGKKVKSTMRVHKSTREDKDLPQKNIKEAARSSVRSPDSVRNARVSEFEDEQGNKVEDIEGANQLSLPDLLDYIKELAKEVYQVAPENISITLMNNETIFYAEEAKSDRTLFKIDLGNETITYLGE